MGLIRQVVAYKRYFLDFYAQQPDNVQAKIEWTLNLIRVTQHIPEKYFKHIEGTKSPRRPDYSLIVDHELVP